MNKPTFFNEKTTRRTFLRNTGKFFASHWLASALPVGAGGIYAWAEHDTLSLKLELWDLFYPNLPQTLDGITIAQLSDLHLESLQLKPDRLQAALSSIKPDLLTLTGDVISTRTDLDKVASYLAALPARYGRYITMGNNDYSHFSHTLFERYLRLLRGLGWIPLLNEARYLPGLDLWIIGVDDPATAHDDVPKAYSALLKPAKPAEPTSAPPFRLVLAHSTDCLDDVAYYGANLFLTGHTHGGQIRLPGFRPFITNTYLADKGIYEGYHVIQGVPLYINRGIGESVLPLRLNVLPEIAFFTLHKGDQTPRHRTKSG